LLARPIAMAYEELAGRLDQDPVQFAVWSGGLPCWAPLPPVRAELQCPVVLAPDRDGV
jgi:hypothetical protein